MTTQAKERSTGKKLKPLIPVDLVRCQAQRKEGCWPDAQHFMIIGPPALVRCKNKPTHVLKETKPGFDGRKGAMSLCSNCLAVFIDSVMGDVRDYKIKPI